MSQSTGLPCPRRTNVRGSVSRAAFRAPKMPPESNELLLCSYALPSTGGLPHKDHDRPDHESGIVKNGHGRVSSVMADSSPPSAALLRPPQFIEPQLPWFCDPGTEKTYLRLIGQSPWRSIVAGFSMHRHPQASSQVLHCPERGNSKADLSALLRMS